MSNEEHGANEHDAPPMELDCSRQSPRETTHRRCSPSSRTTYDAAFFLIPLPANVPATIHDRAYTSPIWYTAEN